MIEPPKYDPRFNQGLVELWRDGESALFRVDHSVPAPVIEPGELPVPRWERDVILREGHGGESRLPDPEASPVPEPGESPVPLPTPTPSPSPTHKAKHKAKRH